MDSRKEVYFDIYCHKCEHEKDSEWDEKSPCYECLENFWNTDSHKPVSYKEKS